MPTPGTARVKDEEPGADPRAELFVVELVLPGCEVRRVGVLLLQGDHLYSRFTADWAAIAPGEDAEVLAAIEDQITADVQRLGAPAVVANLRDTLSNVLRLLDRGHVDFGHPQSDVERFYTEACGSE